MYESVCEKVVKTFGIERRIKKAIEELTELSLALQHGRGIEEEIADVEIMCLQLRKIYSPYIIDTYKEFKLKRLDNFIDIHEERKK